YRDWNGNVVHHFTIVNFHNRIEVSARSLVAPAPATGTLAATDPTPLGKPAYELLDFLEFGGPVRDGAALRAFSDATRIEPGAGLADEVLALGRHIRERFVYRKKVT